MDKKKELIAQLLKEREALEKRIIDLDEKALVYYELEQLNGRPTNQILYSEDELLDAITVFNISTSCDSVKDAKEKFPDLFKSKRKFAKEWIVKFFNL
jgi:hypothetical protein